MRFVQELETRRMMSANVPAAEAMNHVAGPVIAQPLKKKGGTPSTGITVSLKSGRLTVNGSGSNDVIEVGYSKGMMSVFRGGKGGKMKGIYSIKPAKVQSVWVNGGQGNDHISVKDVYNRLCFVTGGKGDDFIHGSDWTDDIEGNDGNDEIHGHDGHDLIYGNDGGDTLVGQEGNDRIDGGYGEDKLIGGMGDDDLYATDGHYHDYISGGSGDDWCSADRDTTYPDDVVVWETGVQNILGDIEVIS